MDYNIYIHSVESGDENQFKPWRSSETSEDGGFSQSNKKSYSSYAMNPDALVGKAAGKLTTVAKTIAPIAAAFAVLKIGDKCVETMTSFYTAETGQYAFATSYHNLKNGINSVLHPISSTMNYFRQQQQYKLNNQRAEVQRSLFGDVAFNNGNFYGV